MRIAVGFLFSLLVLAGCNAANQRQEKLIEAAKASVSAQLLDPTSPLFSEVTANAAGTNVCGLVNGKNRLGAYVGSKRFMYSAGQATLEPENRASSTDRSSMQATGICLFNIEYLSCKGGPDQSSVDVCYRWLDKEKAAPAS